MTYRDMLLTRLSLYWTLVRWFGITVGTYYSLRLVLLAFAAGWSEDLVPDLAAALVVALPLVARPPKDIP